MKPYNYEVYPSDAEEKVFKSSDTIPGSDEVHDYVMREMGIPKYTGVVYANSIEEAQAKVKGKYNVADILILEIEFDIIENKHN